MIKIKNCDEEGNKYLVVVAFDITSNKRRYRMNKTLEAYGSRVQKSVYECYVSNRQFNNLQKLLMPIIDIGEDSLLMYKIVKDATCIYWGKVSTVDTQAAVII